jgi:hypothetical protein
MRAGLERDRLRARERLVEVERDVLAAERGHRSRFASREHGRELSLLGQAGLLGADQLGDLAQVDAVGRGDGEHHEPVVGHDHHDLGERVSGDVLRRGHLLSGVRHGMMLQGERDLLLSQVGLEVFLVRHGICAFRFAPRVGLAAAPHGILVRRDVAVHPCDRPEKVDATHDAYERTVANGRELLAAVRGQHVDDALDRVAGLDGGDRRRHPILHTQIEGVAQARRVRQGAQRKRGPAPQIGGERLPFGQRQAEHVAVGEDPERVRVPVHGDEEPLAACGKQLERLDERPVGGDGRHVDAHHVCDAIVLE